MANDAESLGQLARLAREAGAPELVEEAEQLAERARGGGFYLACVGQFKRGKSTLINALLGQPILPMGLVPVTAVPVILRSGPAAARVCLKHDATWHPISLERIPEYVTEEGNPQNRRGAVAVEVHVDASVLTDGLCLVDTPGLGSVFAWNAASTRAFAPQIDALLILTGVDPPVTADELALLDGWRDTTIPRLLVQNKADRELPAAMEEAAAFTRTIMADRLGWQPDRVFHVSARDALAGMATYDWPELLDAIRKLAVSDGHSLAELAVRRGALRLRDRLRTTVQEQRAALLRPLADSERRLASLRLALSAAQRSVLELGPLLQMEERHIARGLEERCAAFLAKCTPTAADDLASCLRQEDQGRRRRPALEAAVRVAQRHVVPWLHESEPVVAKAYDATMRQMAVRANAVLEQLRAADGELSPLLPDGLSERQELTAASRFRFLGYYPLVAPAGFRWLARVVADRLLPAQVLRRRNAMAAQRLLDRLLEVNTSRVQYDFIDRVQENRRLLEAEIRQVLLSASETAERAVNKARQLHAAGADSVAVELARLDGLVVQLERDG